MARPGYLEWTLILTDRQRRTVTETRLEVQQPAHALAARLRIVLVDTSHPGNIGATARAMKAMGVSDLRLVAPDRFPDAAATARAAGADDILAAAQVHDSLAAALVGATMVYATSVRGRRIDWPTLSPRAAASEIMHAATAQVALVFGSERTGLSNAELDLCQRLITVPTVADFSSLNLAQAVQICLYECHLLTAAPTLPERRRRASERAATAAEVEQLKLHCLRVMEAVGYHRAARPKLLDRRLRRLLGRAALVDSEVQILRGFLAAIEQRLAP